ncbi:MAG TPA: phospholipid carrier-dependent glycosyltransferase [Candidatus Sulfotelmatobacter sp.]|nr:phospholipid carrier-dependent glycosyltransferase [Candidatus Sulfotelmatobacter sp.]
MVNRVTSTGLLIGVLSFLFFLFGIGTPASPFFDEPYYVVGARSFLSGVQDMNPQDPPYPPLTKVLMAAAMKVAGDNPLGWRLASTAFGALTLVAIFFWTYLLLEDYGLALTAAALSFLNDFLFVMSRIAMLDVFYFAFVMWGVLAFTASILLDVNIVKRRTLLYSAGLLFGLGAACKWNTVVTLAAVVVVAGFLYVRGNINLRAAGAVTLVVSLMVVPVIAYCLAFWPVCWRFHRPFTFTELISLNVSIWHFHVTDPGNPILDSRWYSWLFRSTPERGQSYLMGNFVVVWVGLLALLICAWRFCRLRTLPEGLVTLFYAANLLQWVIIPQRRTVYYYYYGSAMFLGVALAIVLGRTQTRRLFGVRLEIPLCACAAVFFLYCYPRMASLGAPYDCMLGCWP